MKFGVPWRAKGIRPEARETAMEAARRSGMSLDDWLNSVILQQAAQAGVQPYAPQATPQQADPRALAAVNGRLDDLSRRIEQFTRSGPPAYAPQRPAQTRGPDPRAELIGRLDQYVHNARPAAPQAMQPAQPMMQSAQPMMRNHPAQPMPMRRAPTQPGQPAMHQAIADIAARQQMLNGGAAPRRRHAPAPASSPAAYAPPATRAAHAAQAAAPVPAQDLSGLEEQLRKITNQIETLRYPGVEEAINALRAELGEIGHALGEAVPRHSIETIEHQIQGLTQRIAEGRQSGVDQGALAGIEHGLMEVRDALHGLTPAENLVGFNDAVAGLAQKIDLIVAQKDPETMAQLENAITTLRGMANHVASNDAVSALSAEVQALGDKVDYIAHASANADALSSLEQRIDALGAALAERAQNGNAVPPRLEALVQSLSDKIEQIQAAQQAHGADVAGNPLDNRIAMLVDRLDASDSRIGQLEAIERGLSDLLLHIEESQRARAAEVQGGGSAAVDAFKYDLAQAQESLKHDIAQSQDALKNDLVHSQLALKGDIARTQDALDQVHGTLGELVQRLATIEHNIRNEARAPAAAPARDDFHEQPAHDPYAHDDTPLELTQPVGKLAVRLVEDAAPGMSAFDGMVQPHAAHADHAAEPPPLAYESTAHEPSAYEPAAYEHIEPEVAAPPMQPDPPPMAEPEPPVMHDAAEPEHGVLPRAPQLEVSLEALRAHAAAQAAAEAAAQAVHAPPREEQRPRTWAPEVPAPRRIPSHGPINPDLPPDEPLEPGSGPPRLRANHGARIAASEAALGRAHPAENTPAAGGKSSFIAAARRAAQAAMQLESAPAPAAEPEDETVDGNGQPVRKSMMRRMKSLFVAASIVAIVVGSVQIATTMLRRPNAPTRTTQKHLSMERQAETANTAAAARAARPAANPMATAEMASPLTTTPTAMVAPTASIDLLAPPDQTVRIDSVPTPDPRRTAQNLASNELTADITGSIPDASSGRSAPPAPAAGHRADLPDGIGGPRLRQAAIAGDSAAAYEVAMRFAEGRGVPTNLSLAARWYERAANKGLAPAQFRLASLLEKGEGVKKDLSRARALYFSAARQGNAKAMHNLAVLYAEGIDGKPDYATAVQWFRDAAEHGVSDSQYNLGILCARGIGVDKSLPESYKWFALAAKQGDKEAAKKRDEVAARMDAKALATARQAVAKFAAKPQPRQATEVPAPPGGWDKTTATHSPRFSARNAGAVVVGKR